MKSREVALIIIFTALCIALVPFRIPALNWPGMYYYWWEIPIIVAFFLFGWTTALLIAVLNAFTRLVFFQVPGVFLMFAASFPPLLTMLFGVYLANRLISRHSAKGKPLSETKKIVCITTLGVAVRATIMPFVDFLNYHTVYPYFLGQTFSETFIAGLLPGILLFNIIVPLYGVSIGYIVAKSVAKSLKIGILA